MDCLDEGRLFCMKQINENNDRLYFGIPWKYNQNWMGCYLCNLGLGRQYAFNPPSGMPTGRPKLKRIFR